MSTKPKAPTNEEWREIVKMPGVRAMWGLETADDERALIKGNFAAKFSYMSDGPGYAGDLFVLLGGEPECPPVVIVRDKGGGLEIADWRN